LFLLLAMLSACPGPASAAQAPSGKTFLITSDIHFNPMSDGSLVADLAASDPTQWETILGRSKSTSFSQYGEDTNWWLLQSSLDQMRATLPHPAFILMTGDLIAHQFPQTYLKTTKDGNRENYRKFVLKTVEFLAWNSARGSRIRRFC
jgi:sphingomyelin phosphodiesterase acid-like 3